MKKDKIFEKAINGEALSVPEAQYIFEHGELTELMAVGHQIRKKKKGGNIVTWLIDRNVNITNICFSQCTFCNFCRKPTNKAAYITSIEDYKQKVDELFALGGDQLLLQGGMHPKLGLKFYIDLFATLKQLYPDLKLHALGPAEIVHISKLEGITYKDCLQELIQAGLDSLPGAGAEILSNRVRTLVSPAKCTSEEWLEVMRQAHKLFMITSATMMFGHLETLEERLIHLQLIREVQHEKPEGAKGFISFIPWPIQNKGTKLLKRYPDIGKINDLEYIRMIAISRIMLNNVENIQPSWLTVGKESAQICLHAGGNDFGSVMIEENVVSSAGAQFKLTVEQMKETIREAGFTPRQRNQKYEFID